MSNSMTYAQGGLPMAAEYVRSKGRNEDTQLVHMTPGEVNALQKMAEDHGGSLTINPHTGLPEAGFLGNVLSVAAPAALSFAFPGVGTAIGSSLGLGTGALSAGIGMGLLTGGITALTTGSLEKGLGAGLTSGLLAGGTKALFNPTAASTPGNLTSAVKTPAIPLEALKNAPSYSPGINLTGTDPFAGLGQQTVAQGANVVAPTYASMMENPAVYKGATQVAELAPTSAGTTTGINLAGRDVFGAVGEQAAEPSLIDKFTNLSPGKKLAIGAGGLGLLGALAPQPKLKTAAEDKGTIRPYTYQSAMAQPTDGRTQYVEAKYDAFGNPVLDTRERNYMNQSYTALPTYKAASGGLMDIGSMDQNNMYPQSQQVHTNFATPTQMPTSSEVIRSDYDMATDPYLGTPLKMASGGSATRDEAYASAEKNKYSYNPETQQYTYIEPPPPPPQQMERDMANWFGRYRGMGGMNQPYMGMGGMNQGYMGIGGLMGRLPSQPRVPAAPAVPSYKYDPESQEYTQLASGGLSNLGSYSDGGHLLKGPGDGVSDDIPAMIGKHQPARLADGEFVVPARIVSELGNGSTDAGAKRLYAMMDRIQAGRKKTVGKGKVAVDSKASKHLPA